MKHIFYVLFFSLCVLAFGQEYSNGNVATDFNRPYNQGSYQANQGSNQAIPGYGIAVDGNYILKPSDVIQVSILLEPDLDKSVRIEADGGVVMSSLPTSDPSVAGELWNNSGVINISAG